MLTATSTTFQISYIAKFHNILWPTRFARISCPIFRPAMNCSDVFSIKQTIPNYWCDPFKAFKLTYFINIVFTLAFPTFIFCLRRFVNIEEGRKIFNGFYKLLPYIAPLLYRLPEMLLTLYRIPTKVIWKALIFTPNPLLHFHFIPTSFLLHNQITATRKTSN